MSRIFLVFTAVALADLWILARIGAALGPWVVLLLVVVPAVLGARLARREGLRVWRAWQLALAERRVPDEGVLSGLLVLVGGALLVFPGLITGVLGIALLLPPVRRAAAAVVRRWLQRQVAAGRVRVVTIGHAGGGDEPIDVTPGVGPNELPPRGGRPDGVS